MRTCGVVVLKGHLLFVHCGAYLRVVDLDCAQLFGCAHSCSVYECVRLPLPPGVVVTIAYVTVSVHAVTLLSASSSLIVVRSFSSCVFWSVSLSDVSSFVLRVSAPLSIAFGVEQPKYATPRRAQTPSRNHLVDCAPRSGLAVDKLEITARPTTGRSSIVTD